MHSSSLTQLSPGIPNSRGNDTFYAVKSNPSPAPSPLNLSTVLLEHRENKEHSIEMRLPRVVIEEEPEEKFRFRYITEMQGTHGCIRGKSFNKKNKKFPTTKVEHVPHHIDKLRVRAGLYAAHDKKSHHVHKLMWKQFSSREENFVEAEINRSQGFEQVWQGLGIIHTSRRILEETLLNRKKKIYLEEKAVRERNPHVQLNKVEEINLKADAKNMSKEMTNKMNNVTLGFEVFTVVDGVYYPLCEMVFSQEIKNLKNPTTGDLKITRMSTGSGSVQGGDEVFIFTERVIKGNIKIRFFQENDEEERIWEEFAIFSENDVHHQYAIVFRTPTYRDTGVTESVDVYYELFRPSDEAVSEKKTFRFKPTEETMMRKRKRIRSNLEVSEPVPFINPPRFGGVQYRAEEQQDEDEDSNMDENNLTIDLNVINDLCSNSDYVETLAYPSPYDHVTDGGPMELVPDFLLRAGQLQPIAVGGNISTDSVAGGTVSEDVSGQQIAECLSYLLHQFSATNDKGLVFQRVKQILAFITSQGNNTLHSGVLSGEGEVLEYILEVASRIQFNEILEELNNEGFTPLHLAVKLGNSRHARMLLKYNVNPDTLSKDGNTAIHLAVSSLNLEMVSVLLGSNLKLNIPNNDGLFPLHVAVKCGRLDLVAALVNKGVDIDARDRVTGRTPLHLALINQFKQLADYLLQAGADTTLEDYSGETVEVLAERLRLSALVRPEHPSITKDLLSRLSEHRTEPRARFQDLPRRELELLLQQLKVDNKWKIFASNLRMENIIPNLEKMENPSLALLHYIQEQSSSMDDVVDALSSILIKEEC